jgi:hypothetical protein
MTDKDEWTLADVVRVVVVQFLIRSAIAFGLSLLAAFGLSQLIHALESQIGQQIRGVSWGLIIVVGAAVGYPQGLVMSRGMAGRTGLSGGALLAIAYVLLIGIHYATYVVWLQLAPEWQIVFFYLFGMLGIANLIAAGKTLLIG